MKILIELHEDIGVHTFARTMMDCYQKTIKSATVIPDSEHITLEQMEEKLKEAQRKVWRYFSDRIVTDYTEAQLNLAFEKWYIENN